MNDKLIQAIKSKGRVEALKEMLDELEKLEPQPKHLLSSTLVLPAFEVLDRFRAVLERETHICEIVRWEKERGGSELFCAEEGTVKRYSDREPFWVCDDHADGIDEIHANLI